jgi:hypothetical protein
MAESRHQNKRMLCVRQIPDGIVESETDRCGTCPESVDLLTSRHLLSFHGHTDLAAAETAFVQGAGGRTGGGLVDVVDSPTVWLGTVFSADACSAFRPGHGLGEKRERYRQRPQQQAHQYPPSTVCRPGFRHHVAG